MMSSGKTLGEALAGTDKNLCESLKKCESKQV